MENINQIIFTACTGLIIGEIIYYLSPKDKITDAIYALFYTVIIISACLNFSNIELNIDEYLKENSYQEEIDEKINEYYIFNTEKEMKNTIESALKVINISCENVETIIKVENEQIEIRKIKVILKHSSDIKNAQTILKTMFQDIVPIEIIVE